jgi:hypothetical protein
MGTGMGARPYIGSVLVAIALAATSGCVPYLARGAVAYGLKGQLVDEATGRPLPAAEYLIRADCRKFAGRTSADGRFETPPDHALYWTWMICGPVLCPQDWEDVGISVDGFLPYRTRCFFREPRAESRPSKWLVCPEEEDYFLIGPVPLRRTNSSSPASRPTGPAPP